MAPSTPASVTGSPVPIVRGLAALTSLAAGLAGVPWLLWQLGPPLPAGWPSTDETAAVLTGPLSGQLLLRILTGVAWLVWAGFLIETALAALEAAADIRALHDCDRADAFGEQNQPGTARPRFTHRLPAALISAVVLAVLAARPGSAALATSAPIAAVTSRTTDHQHEHGLGPVGSAADRHAAPSAQPQHGDDALGIRWRSVRVRAPHGRVHDSLWRIAERELGNARRWHEIYALNAGRIQPDGRHLEDPDLIQPGWILRLPAEAQKPATSHDSAARRPRSDGQATRRPAPVPARAPLAPIPAPLAGTSSTPAAAHQPIPSASGDPSLAAESTVNGGTGRDHNMRAGEPARQAGRQGVDLPAGGYVGLWLAAAVVAAVVMARRRRRHRVDLDGRTPLRLPVTAASVESLPRVITMLQRAHQDSLDADDEPRQFNQEAMSPDPRTWWVTSPGHLEAGPASTSPAAITGPGSAEAADPMIGSDQIRVRTRIVLGEFQGRPVAVDLDHVGGLGLLGPGAPDAARAVIASLLAAQQRPRSAPTVRMIIPRTVADDLLGCTRLPLTRVTETLDVAVDEADRHASGQLVTSTGLLVLETSDPTEISRVGDLLNLYRGTGRLVALILGRLPTGLTCHVDRDGHVNQLEPGQLESGQLRPGEPDAGGHQMGVPMGTLVYRLGSDDLTGILDVLDEAFDARADTDAMTGWSPKADASESAHAPPGRTPSPVQVQRPSSRNDSEPAAVSLVAGTVEAYRAEPAIAGPGALVGDEVGPIADPGRGIVADWVDAARTGAGQWSPPLAVRLLGPQRLEVRGVDAPHGLRGRTKELFVLVLLHPAGITGQALAEALWPEQVDGLTWLRSTMKRLRGQLRSVTGLDSQMFILHGSGRYRPDRRLISCDAWDFEDAVRRSAAYLNAPATAPDGAEAGPESSDEARVEPERLTALGQAVALYQGTLLDGDDYLWAETYRETLRHHALHVFVRYATAIAANDPEAALAALERTLSIEPYNETLYRRVMRMQAALARPEAVAGTLELLRRHLEDIDEPVSRETTTLALTLQRDHPN